MAALLAVFSGVRIYLIVGLLLAAAAIVSYIFFLKADAANAHAALASTQAVVSVQNAALDEDKNAIAQLQQDKVVAEAAQAAVQSAVVSIGRQVSATQLEASHAKVDAKCQALDPRDLSVIDGVRKLIGPAAGPANASH